MKTQNQNNEGGALLIWSVVIFLAIFGLGRAIEILMDYHPSLPLYLG